MLPAKHSIRLRSFLICNIPEVPEIDHLAKQGNPEKFDLPRSMLHSGDFNFSFSGLKTAVRYLLPKLDGNFRADLCASFQEAII